MLLCHLLMQGLPRGAGRRDRLGRGPGAHDTAARGVFLRTQIVETVRLRIKVVCAGVLARTAEEVQHLKALVFLKVVAALETANQVSDLRKPVNWHRRFLRDA